jgi:tetratricopeptide (TPR) repeat protein
MFILGSTPFRFAAIALAVLFLQFAAANPATAKSCIDWPKLMAQYELSQLPQGKEILVTPFTNFTKRSEDDWMVLGLRDYVVDLMTSARNIRPLSGLTAQYTNDAFSPAWKISGRFQRDGSNLRVFISLFEEPSGKLFKQIEATFPYPDNREFFTRIADASKDLLKAMDANWDSDQFDVVRNATSSTGAYESYARGRQLLETFNPQNMPKAEDLFRDAKKLDYRSTLGYEGIVAANTFLGFYNKQQGQRFSGFYQKAEAELVLMAKLAKPAAAVFGYMSKKPQRKKQLTVKLENRFLTSNTSFMEALHALQAGNLEGAANAMRRSVELVPEDAMVWRELAGVYSKLGDVAKSTEALRKANEIDPCT